MLSLISCSKNEEAAPTTDTNSTVTTHTTTPTATGTYTVTGRDFYYTDVFYINFEKNKFYNYSIINNKVDDNYIADTAQVMINPADSSFIFPDDRYYAKFCNCPFNAYGKIYKDTLKIHVELHQNLGGTLAYNWKYVKSK